ncbi:MAG: hypothetical protein QXE96_05435 [Candidatus Caldarchaeum sp.]
MNLRLIVFVVAWSAATIAALTIGQLYEWPDNVHIRYGIPLTYAVHTVVTILGAADHWSVDTNILAFDLAIWMAGLVTGVALLSRQKTRDGHT